jgi:hypothetical protein
MTLKDRLRELQCSHAGEIDWQRRRDDWLSEIESLYTEVKTWLAGFRDEGLIELDDSQQVHISEPYIGDYDAPKLIVVFPGDESIEIIFEPVGRNVVGALGRIDVYPRGMYGEKYMLILVRREEGPPIWEAWKSKYSPGKRPFDKGVLEEIIEAWLNTFA